MFSETTVNIIYIVTILVIVWFLWKTRSRHFCPECKSRKIALIGKQLQKTNFFTRPGGGKGGAGTTIQKIFNAQYRCKKCHARWTKIITETV